MFKDKVDKFLHMPFTQKKLIIFIVWSTFLVNVFCFNSCSSSEIPSSSRIPRRSPSSLIPISCVSGIGFCMEGSILLYINIITELWLDEQIIKKQRDKTFQVNKRGPLFESSSDFLKIIYFSRYCPENKISATISKGKTWFKDYMQDTILNTRNQSTLRQHNTLEMPSLPYFIFFSHFPFSPLSSGQEIVTYDLLEGRRNQCYMLSDLPSPQQAWRRIMHKAQW